MMIQPPTHDRPTTAGHLPDDCCAATERPEPAERDARWLRAARQARTLSWFSLAWMTGEGVLGLAAGVAANTPGTTPGMLAEIYPDGPPARPPELE